MSQGEREGNRKKNGEEGRKGRESHTNIISKRVYTAV